MSFELRNNLAKLLATEDILVQHKNVPTAYFDTQNRVLGLPIWKDASKDVYDLLVGHEVGHALYTPTTDFKELASTIDPDNVSAVRSFINVVEDARIEKKIKRKFPGLRKNFFSGYEELVNQNFFGINGREMDSYSLIDRINLHFKVGSLVEVPFSDEEKTIIGDVDNVETFDGVIDLVKKIYEHVKNEEEEQDVDSSAEMNDEQSEGSPDSDDFGDESESGDSDDDGDEIEGNGIPQSSETQENFDDRLGETANNNGNVEWTYANIPSVSPEKFIIDYKVVNAQFAEEYKLHEMTLAREEYKLFKRTIGKTVNYLAKGFEMKKSASEYARASISKTGVVDTNKIHSYKFNDDLFRRVTSIPEGKNHGLLMFVDWSGSMSGSIFDTIKQTITLAMFCRRVNIPFEIYTFTDSKVDSDRDYSLTYNVNDMIYGGFNLRNYLSGRMTRKEFDTGCFNLFYNGYVMDKGYWGTFDPLGSTPLNDAIMATFEIYEKFKNENNLEKVNIVYLTDGASNSVTGIYDPENQWGYKALGVNNWSYGDITSFIVDPVTKKSIGVRRPVDVTNALLKHLATRYDTNVVGFFISPMVGGGELQQQIDPQSKMGYNDYQTILKKFRKQKSFTLDNHDGYTEMYLICGGKALAVESDGFNVDADVSKRVLTTAFKKNQRSKVSNKVILDNFINVIS